MVKKKILNTLVCGAIFALLSFCEKRSGVYGIAIAFCIALVFCRVNLLMSVLTFFVVNALVHFSLWHLIVVSSGALCVALYAFIHYKTNLKYRLWANFIAITVSLIPIYFLYGGTTEGWIKTGLSPIIGLMVHYVSVGCVYPISVRGMRYRFTEKEKMFALLLTIPLAVGAISVNIYGVGIYFPILMLSVLLLMRYGAKEIFFAVFAGIGATLSSSSPFCLCASAVVGAVAFLTGKKSRFISVPCVYAGFLFCLYAYGGADALSWQKTVFEAVAALVALAIPNRVFEEAKGYEQSVYGKFALRTVANRDREEVGAKLKEVAVAFAKMQNILEQEGTYTVKPEQLAEEMKNECCVCCAKFDNCRKKTGDVVKIFRKLMETGIVNGGVNMLDVDGNLGGICVKLPNIVNRANVIIRAYKQTEERKSGIEQGREMIAKNLGGTAELMEELAATVKDGFGFDVEGERRITDELAYANIVAGDVAIYGSGDKITLSVREQDEKKKELTEIVSETMGYPFYISERKTAINKTVGLILRPLPGYGVLYGEKSYGVENVCGDAKQAVRITRDKILFVLSDGMGTGEKARKTGLDAMGLIEAFYKAGFSHSTIFACVGRLLAFRTEETFSALDVAIMDTQTGEIVFVKQGGRESYLFTAKGAEKIQSGNLPIGIVGEAKPIIVKKKVGEGDIAVLISDGVADRLDENDITEIVGSLGTLNPQTIAEKIVENALKQTDERKDDMTAMVIRVVKND